MNYQISREEAVKVLTHISNYLTVAIDCVTQGIAVLAVNEPETLDVYTAILRKQLLSAVDLIDLAERVEGGKAND